MMLLAAARDLMIVFLGIELMSISVYVLAGLNRRSRESAEGALKYFLLGAFSTGFLLYGMALIYGATGATNLSTIAARLAGDGLPDGQSARAPRHRIAAGRLWVQGRRGAVPHVGAGRIRGRADADHGVHGRRGQGRGVRRVPACLDRGVPVHRQRPRLLLLLAQCRVGTRRHDDDRGQRLGPRPAQHQAHARVLEHCARRIRPGRRWSPGSTLGASAFLFYLLAYTLATMGAFAVVIALGNTGEAHIELDDYAGLWTARPWLAVAMSVCMLALLGFPIVGGLGFLAKWYVLAGGAPGLGPAADRTGNRCWC